MHNNILQFSTSVKYITRIMESTKNQPRTSPGVDWGGHIHHSFCEVFAIFHKQKTELFRDIIPCYVLPSFIRLVTSLEPTTVS